MRQVASLEVHRAGVSALIALVVLTGDAAARPGEPAAPAAGRVIAGLEEPLVSTRPTSTEEDRSLDLAIAAFRIAAARTSSDGPIHLVLLARFVEGHPSSGWNAAVLANLGISYYRGGYFARALDCWQAAWAAGRDATDPRARALVDRTLGELAGLHARLGHVDELEKLFEDVGGRALGEPAAKAMAAARDAATTMRHDPGLAYRGGPNALKALLLARRAASDSVAFLDKERSVRRGFSLLQLAGLADRAGLRYRLIHREPGQAVPVPSVIHWNVNHFATIVAVRDGGYLVKDSTPGAGTDELWVRQAAIDSEASGFFLVPEDVSQDPRWREATAAEASRIYAAATPRRATASRTAPVRLLKASSNIDLIRTGSQVRSM